MKLVGKEYGSRIGGPPQDRLVVVVPGKDAVSVGFEQSLGSQVAPDSEQAFWGGRINGREAQVRRVCAETEHTEQVTRRDSKSQQDAEKVRQLCSRIAQRLNVPLRVRLATSLSAAALDGLFEHPAMPFLAITIL